MPPYRQQEKAKTVVIVCCQFQFSGFTKHFIKHFLPPSNWLFPQLVLIETQNKMNLTWIKHSTLAFFGFMFFFIFCWRFRNIFYKVIVVFVMLHNFTWCEFPLISGITVVCALDTLKWNQFFWHQQPTR